MKFTSYAQTDTGQVRQLNEDNMRIVIPTQPKDMSRRGELFVVADGMGGHDAGEIASGQAVETIAKVYYSKSGEPDDALKEAIEEANAVIFERAQKEDHHGMGTTVVAASRIDDRLYIAHVGDSRLYLIRQGEIYPLTNDHSLVAEQIKAGILTPEEALSHPLRNVISRAVGTTPDVEVEISSHSPLVLQEGDIVLLCSDGLTEHVREHEIVQIVSNRPPKQATQALIQAANRGGGRDNITVILGRVGDIPEGDERAAATLPLNPLSAPTKKLPTLKENPQALAVRKRSRSSNKRRSSVFWLRAFLLLVIILGIGGAVMTRFNSNLNFNAFISPILPSSPTPSPTTTIILPTPPTPLPTFTPVLGPLTPTEVSPTRPAVTPSPTSTFTPTFTATPTVSATSTASNTPIAEPSATQTAENSENQSENQSEDESNSNNNQQANFTTNDTPTSEISPTLTVRTSSNQASRPSNETSTPEISGTALVTVTLTLTPTRSNEQSPTPTAERNTFRPSSVSTTPVLSPTISATIAVTPSATTEN